MKRISSELLTRESNGAAARIDHDKIMAESRRTGVPDDELRRVAMDEFYEDQEWERKEEALRVAIAREAVANAHNFGGSVQLLGRALRRYLLDGQEIIFSSKFREEKFFEITRKIEKEVGL